MMHVMLLRLRSGVVVKYTMNTASVQEVCMDNHAVVTTGHQLIEHLERLIDEDGGITQLSKKTGLARTHLYRIVAGKGNPQLSTLLTILDAIGLEIHVVRKGTRKGVPLVRGKGRC